MRPTERELNLVRIYPRAAADENAFARRLLERLAREGFASATLVRGHAGFVNEAREPSSLLSTAVADPSVIEVVDDDGHTERLLAILADVPELGALVTVQKVRALEFTRG